LVANLLLPAPSAVRRAVLAHLSCTILLILLILSNTFNFRHLINQNCPHMQIPRRGPFRIDVLEQALDLIGSQAGLVGSLSDGALNCLKLNPKQLS
jgi:hypothetical protein